MTSALADQLALGSLGLLIAAAVLEVTYRKLARDPSLAHRIFVAALFLLLALPIAQIALAGAAPRTLARFAPPPPSRLLARAATGPVPELPAAIPAAAESARRLPAETAPIAAVQDAPPPAAEAPALPSASPALPSAAKVPPWFDSLALLYLGGVLALGSLRFARGAAGARRVRAFPAVATPEVLAAWQGVAGRSRLYSRIQLVTSAGARAPACCGIARHRVVLPLRDANGPRTPALEWALLHELVHLERGDTRTALAQSVFTTLFWFHPAAWWLSRRIDRLREISCDLAVVRRAGHRKSYALALLEYSTPPESRSELAAAAAIVGPLRPESLPMLLHWSESPSELRRRIEMLMSSRNPLSRARRFSLAAGAGAVLAFVWAGQMTIAATFSDDSADEVLVARCDPKKKQAPRRDMQVPRTPGQRKVQQQGEIVLAGQDSGAGGTSDSEVREALVGALLGGDEASVRMAAANALAPYVAEPRVQEAFAEALRERGSPAERAGLLQALMQRESVSPEFKELLVRVVAPEESDRLRFLLAPSGSPAEGRRDLIQALANEHEPVAQLRAARQLAREAADPEVCQALLSGLRESRNEVARMAMLEGLGPIVAGRSDVQELFVMLLERDDNPVARLAVARALADAAGEPDVRRALLRGLTASDPVVQVTIAEALMPYAREPEVKSAFVSSLARIDSEVVRISMVEALASAMDPAAPRGDAAARSFSGQNLFGDGREAALVPAMSGAR